MYVLRNYFLILTFLLLNIILQAQNYQAINGSSYAGSLSPTNNPSSIVHVPYAWDVTLFAVQTKEATNAIKIRNYSLLKKATNAEIQFLNGSKKRLAYADQNIHLLNARISINSKVAVAFGVNIRSYEFLQTTRYTWRDSIGTLRDFGNANFFNTPLSGKTIGASWAEVYGTYAQTIKDDGNNVLNAGVTFKADRGLAGAYANAEGINYLTNVTNNGVGYLLEEGSLQYGYSSNLDDVNNNSGFRDNVKNFMRRTFSSVSVDAGIEYIMLSGSDNDYEYDTKIGVSLMDIGHVHFRYGNNSRLAIAGKNNISDSLLQNKFGSINSFNDFNDSLATVAMTISALGGDFFISQPTRFIVNVDQHLSDNFFINGELTVPISPAAVKNKLYLEQMNLAAVTPRWENRTFGVYLPIQFNQVKQLWIGGAFKAGPLLFGIHNWANIFSKNSMQNGGFYLAVTLRPGSSHDKSSRDDDQKLSRRERKKLDCPRF
ncbi:MAG TPA: hypothetical protein VHD35_01620 [Chitinophagaceae bacterium]|nr:hypothetical protein [Chitinophagaceae bacterium]